jgi:hypothetical protein
MINPLENFSEVSVETSNDSKPILPVNTKAKIVVKKAPAESWNSVANISKAAQSIMPYDRRPVKELVSKAADQAGISRELLMTSAYQEGMNKMLSKPDVVSESWNKAYDKDISMGNFPVDGFHTYGLDFIGEKGKVPEFQKKGYLPVGFENMMKVYNAVNEKKKIVPTAAFRNNQAALMAKAAMLRDSQDKVDEYAASHKLKLNPKERNYFTVAAYNGGWGNGREMIDEYIKSKDKGGFVDKGLTSKKQIHKNVYPRVSALGQYSPLFK